MNTICKICKKSVDATQDRVWIRRHKSSKHNSYRIYTQSYHTECFEVSAGADFMYSLELCAICEQNVQRTNSRSTVCEKCIDKKC